MAPFRKDQVGEFEITGAFLVDLDVRTDERGMLWEMIHATDEFVRTTMIRQVYVVTDPMPGTVRAYHRHIMLHDWFHICSGSAIFCLVDDDRNNMRLTLTARKPQLLVVPPTVYHGWCSLEPNTILVSAANQEYNALNPDEERIPADSFDDLFPNGEPWEVQAK